MRRSKCSTQPFSRKVRRGVGTACGAVVVLGVVVGCTPESWKDSEEPPERPTVSLGLEDLLAEPLAEVEKAIGVPGVDNTLPRELSRNGPELVAVPEAFPIDAVPRSELVVTAICIDTEKPRFVYGVADPELLSFEDYFSLGSGGQSEAEELQRVSGCEAWSLRYVEVYSG